MPNRIIRENILTSEKVNLLSAEEEVFYRRLLNIVDDFGRFDARPAVLRARLYPLRVETISNEQIDTWLLACEKAGLLVTYDVDGKRFLEAFNCGSPRARESKFPKPPELNRMQMQTSARIRIQMHTDANKCEQMKTSVTDVPYSNSNSLSYSNSSSYSGKESEKPDDDEKEKFPTAHKAWNSFPDCSKAFAVFGKLIFKSQAKLPSITDDELAEIILTVGNRVAGKPRNWPAYLATAVENAINPEQILEAREQKIRFRATEEDAQRQALEYYVGEVEEFLSGSGPPRSRIGMALKVIAGELEKPMFMSLKSLYERARGAFEKGKLKLEEAR